MVHVVTVECITVHAGVVLNQYYQLLHTVCVCVYVCVCACVLSEHVSCCN